MTIKEIKKYIIIMIALIYIRQQKIIELENEFFSCLLQGYQ